MPGRKWSETASAVKRRFVIENTGADKVGYWLGYCPLHDFSDRPAPARFLAGELGSAEFDFTKGGWRCIEEDKHCHDLRELGEFDKRKKGGTLANLVRELDEKHPGWDQEESNA